MILVPSEGGRFELFVDDRPIYSKLETGRFPEARDVIRWIEEARKA